MYIFLTAGIYFSGTSYQIFFVCQLTFCELTKEKVRNNPMQENIVILNSYIPMPQTEVEVSH